LRPLRKWMKQHHGTFVIFLPYVVPTLTVLSPTIFKQHMYGRGGSHSDDDRFPDDSGNQTR
jgi:hypothetical protein